MSDTNCPFCGSLFYFSSNFYDCGSHHTVLTFIRTDLCREREAHNQTKRERDEAMDVLSYLSHYLSCGIGDENTTPQQYKERILDGIKFLMEHSKQITLDMSKTTS